mmetsp:Transcript_12986/g.14696  ORF Transcript_12986/g.14696 Transcript_12986/m.14696 type:complete len:401 (+) Transcript_12986:43-1245(+)
MHVKATAVMISLLNVFNGALVASFVVAFLLKVHHEFGDELKKFWNKQKDLAAWQKAAMTIEEEQAMKSEEEKVNAVSKRIYIAVWCVGIAFNFLHLGVMFGGIFDYHVDSTRMPWDAVIDTLNDPHKRTFQMWMFCVNALGEFTSGLIIVDLLAVLIHAGCFVLLNLSAYIKRSTDNVEKISKKPGPLEEHDLTHVALEVCALQEQLCLSQDPKCFGHVFLMALVIPLAEMLYWVFNLALLSQVDVTLARNTRGLAGFAAGIGCLCFLDILFMAYMLSTVSSNCSALRGKFSCLLVRGTSKIPDETVTTEATLQCTRRKDALQYIRQIQENHGDIFANQATDRRIRQIQEYMLYVNAGDPMGFYVYGVHMTAGLFKSLLISYVSLMAVLAPKAVHFFNGD